ncbi:MFS transporter [Nocardia sp. 2]|uniref:MFS transporter n=2 Tax=Nocardia acididurans TaxID=2802282 RepID=A0ABS1ME99_9NOCA|nr:MFS transporter [Nocardia acididurans]
MPSDALDERAGKREWIGLGVLTLACLVYAMDLTVLHLAVPQISAQLQPTSSQLLWIIDVYGFLVAGLLITMGTLGDRIGRRKLLMYGAVLFGVVSVLAAFAPTAETLILCRALLGIAGATIAPSTLSLIFNMFRDARQRSLAVGAWVTAFSAGGVIGPVLGGLMLEHFWWGSVFLLAVPVMVLLLVLGPRVLPEFRDEEAGRLDLISAALSVVAMISLVLAMKNFAQDGAGIVPLVALTVGLAAGALFVRRQLNRPDPMLDLRLFRFGTFRTALAINMIGIFVAFGYFLFVAQYFQLVLGMSPLKAGLVMAPSSLGFIIGSQAAPHIVRFVRPAYLIGAAMALAAIGLAMLTQVPVDGHPLPVVIASSLIALGLAPVFGITTELIVGSAPPEQAGAASGLSETAAELGGALGISVLGSISIAIYRGGLDDTLPHGIPGAEAVRDTLGAAVEVAATLPGPLGEAVLQAARESFVQGMHLIVGIAAVAALAVSALAVAKLRHLPAGEISSGDGQH